MRNIIISIDEWIRVISSFNMIQKEPLRGRVQFFDGARVIRVKNGILFYRGCEHCGKKTQHLDLRDCCYHCGALPSGKKGSIL